MAKAIGEVIISAGGKEYTLRLTMRSLAILQDEFGQDLAPIIGLKPGQMPHFGICLRMVELALQKHHADVASPVLADDILTGDMAVVGRLIEAAFPDASAGDQTGKPVAAGH